MALFKSANTTSTKTDRQLLEDCLRLLKNMQEEIEEIKESIEELEGKNFKDELKELKEENKQQRMFMQDVMLKLIDVKASQAAKPSPLEAYQLRKAEEAKAEASRTNGAKKALPLPG